jgi:hypothetical protein
MKLVKMMFIGYYGYRHDESLYKVTVIRIMKGKKAKVVPVGTAMTTHDGVEE